MTHNVKFFVGLSNGENVYEGKGEFDKPKAWLSLQEYLKENRLEITSLGLYSDKGQIWNLPSRTRLPIEKLNEYIEKKGVTLKVARLIKKDKSITRIEIPQGGDPQEFLKPQITDDVTGIVFYTPEGKGLYFPLSSTNPKVKDFFDLKILGFNFFRIQAEDRDMGGQVVGEVDRFAVIEALFENHKLQIWVNENSPRISWTLSKPT